jgi:hypothetical protein
MEADMASAWQTLEEAALTLGISSRTLHRRITKNEVETRLTNGRREVLVTVPDPEPAAPAAESPIHTSIAQGVGSSAPFSTMTIDQPAVSPVSDEVGQTMLALHEDRVRRSDLAIMAYQQSINVAALDARRSRAGSRLAWSVAGGVTVALFLSVVYATHTVTRAQAQVQSLTTRVQSASAAADSNARAAETFRQQAEQARIEAARAQGELAMTRAHLQPAGQADQASATFAPLSATPQASSHADPVKTAQPKAAQAPVSAATPPTHTPPTPPTPASPPAAGPTPTTRPEYRLDRLRGQWPLP